MDALPSLLLGIYLTGTGIGHFVAARYFESLVPLWVPAPRFVVAASGVAELIVAVLLFVPATRVMAAWAAAAMIASFLVVWFDALRHSRGMADRLSNRPTGVLIKIVVNLGYITWAVWAARVAA